MVDPVTTPHEAVTAAMVDAGAQAVADIDLAGSVLDRMADAPVSRRRTIALAVIERVYPLIAAAERERIRQLAIGTSAIYSQPTGGGDFDEAPFAALLEEDGT